MNGAKVAITGGTGSFGFWGGQPAAGQVRNRDQRFGAAIVVVGELLPGHCATMPGFYGASHPSTQDRSIGVH